ncbi:motility associated factor glycosyltransferase family protein [Clostridium cellulovorans]|uniref:6-hydroxymethylpterin diphosphokinase MptE-like domain-containing protein n=1 Tax=Clostridium cellulovorans (strain ATCC 35296 / DSM 3052 / OCM 3 / 743B) TaxID=573061 RepID=D9SPX2_CLOC7|nr:6-hydroxymethylpterin diphosphokinase MptE-like protein [Clostridium cellulovorans]ADL52108.1 protein of unknown function DUF115 [Clostridium cellulovorans 743B]
MEEHSLDEKIEVVYEKSKDGYDIVKLSIENKSRYLGSKYNAENDINKIIEDIGELEDFATVLVIGLGTGEYIKRLKDKMNSTMKLLVVEPNKEIFETYAKSEKYSELQEFYKDTDGNVDCLNGQNINIFCFEKGRTINIEESIQKNAFYQFKIINHPGYTTIFPKEVLEITGLIRDGIRSAIFNKNTAVKFSKAWFESTVRNLRYLCNETSINRYKNIHENIPAVIVSAGPSLDKNIKELKKAKGKFIIICGGRTLRPLVENGIIPDYMSIIDNSEQSNALVSDLLEKYDIPLIHSEIISHKVLELHKGKRIFYSHSGFINKIAKEETENISIGGSVAHSCTRFAIHCGCNPIIFIGQDLAYTNEKVHADNAKFIQEKFADAEKFEKVAGDMDKYVKDVFGGLVRTSQSLDYFRLVLEDILEYYKEFKYINATEGGAHIKGTEVRTLKETIEEYYDRQEIEVPSFGQVADILDLDIVKKVLDDSLSYLEKVSSKMNKALELNEKLKTINRFKTAEVDSTLKKLDKIDEFIMERNDKVVFVDYLLADTVHRAINDSKFLLNGKETYKEKIDKIYNHGKLLYKGINDQVKYAIPIIKDELDKLNN